MQYGVFSQFTVELDDDDANENFYWLSESKLEALVCLGQRVMTRAVGLIPDDALDGVLKAWRLARDTEDISKGFNIAGVTYYVREVDDAELVNLNKISLANV